MILIQSCQILQAGWPIHFIFQILWITQKNNTIIKVSIVVIENFSCSMQTDTSCKNHKMFRVLKGILYCEIFVQNVHVELLSNYLSSGIWLNKYFVRYCGWIHDTKTWWYGYIRNYSSQNAQVFFLMMSFRENYAISENQFFFTPNSPRSSWCNTAFTNLSCALVATTLGHSRAESCFKTGWVVDACFHKLTWTFEHECNI